MGKPRVMGVARRVINGVERRVVMGCDDGDGWQ